MGKNLDGLTRAERNVIDLQLNRIGMGYMEEHGRKPHTPVSWVPEEHHFTHPFSLQRRCDDYGYYRMREVIPLTDYLGMPADIVDTVMSAVRAGADRRLNEEKEKTPPPPPDLDKM